MSSPTSPAHKTRDVLVSVIIPTHNRAELVKEAVASVLAQDGVKTEIIVVDDFSTDETNEVTKQFGPDVKTIRTSRNVERGAARNLGAKAATGTFLAFLDSDDLWEPAKLRRQLRADCFPSVTCLRFFRNFPPGDHVYRPPARAYERLHLENGYLGTPSSILIRREDFFRAGGFVEDRGVQGSEDWLFLLQLRALGIRPLVIPEPLVRFRLHAGNSTANAEAVSVSMWNATIWAGERGLVGGAGLKRMRSRTAGVIARQFAIRGRWRVAASWLRRSFHSGSWYEAIRAAGLAFLSGMKAFVK